MSELNDDARRLLADAGVPTPTAHTRAAMKHAVLAAVAVPVVAATAGATMAKPAAAALSSVLAKVLVGVAVVGVAAGSVFAVSRSRRPPVPVVVAQPPPVAESLPVREELALLGRAKGAFDARQWTEALTVLDAYSLRFPSGSLRPEALALRALTLCALNRAPEAQAVAQELRSAFPESPGARRLDDSCVGR